MKKTLLIIAALLFATPKSMALDQPLEKNEISSQYSLFTWHQIALGFNGMFTGADTFGTFKYNNFYSTGIFKIQYHHTIDEKIMCGFSAGYEWGGLKVNDKDDEPVDRLVEHHFFSLLGSAKIYYQNQTHFGFYAKIQAGVELELANKIEGDKITEEQKIKPHIAIQGVPIGFEFGGETLRAFVEIGVGTQGIWNIGFRKQF